MDFDSAEDTANKRPTKRQKLCEIGFTDDTHGNGRSVAFDHEGSDATRDQCRQSSSARTRIDGNQESTIICYGTLDDIEVITFGKTDHLFSNGNDCSSFVPLALNSRGGHVTVLSVKNRPVGTISKATADALAAISIHGTKLQAYTRKKKLKKQSSNNLRICINVYGPRDIACAVGDILMRHRLYLQSPEAEAYDQSYVYSNPQCFYNDDDSDMKDIEKMDIDAGCQRSQTGPISMKLVPTELQDILQDLLPALPLEYDEGQDIPIPGIKTSLLEHQKSAVQFMVTTEHKALTDTANVGGILADEPGLGKSLTALALMKTSASGITQEGAARTLLVVPNSILDQWTTQIRDHILPCHLKWVVYAGPKRKQDLALASQNSLDLVITSYSTLVADRSSSSFASMIFSTYWMRVILDEAHFIKDCTTKRFEAANALKTRVRWCLTGTPIQNKLEDIDSLLRFLKQPIYGNPGTFKRRVLNPLKRGESAAWNRFQQVMRSIVIRRKKSMIDLPARRDLIVKVGLSDSERRMYNVARDASRILMQRSMSKNYTGANMAIMQSLLRQRQITNHGIDILQTGVRKLFLRILRSEMTGTDPVVKDEFPIFCQTCDAELSNSERRPPFEDCFHMICGSCIKTIAATGDLHDACPICNGTANFPEQNSQTESLRAWANELMYQGPSSKVHALINNIKSAQEKKGEDGCINTKSVVFSEWVKMLYLVERALELEKIGFVRYDGTLSDNERKRVLADFNNDPWTTVLLISIGSGGVGLNLTVASEIHLLEPQWNPMVEIQALDRVHRIGQQHAVTTYRYIAENTFDESIAELQSRKLELAQLALSDQATSTDRHQKRFTVRCDKNLGKVTNIEQELCKFFK